MTVTTAPTTQPGLLARLMEAVEPVFRAEVFIPDADDPVFTFGRCRVPPCNRPLNHAKPGLCNGHRKAWRDASEPPLEEWAATQTRLNYGNVSFPDFCFGAGVVIGAPGT